MTFFYPETNENKFVFFHSEDLLKVKDNFMFNSYSFKLLENKSLYDKIILISEIFISEIKNRSPVLVGIESYSFGSQGRFSSIIENLGYLKVSLVKEQIPFLELAPTTIKKGFSGSGKASKEEMIKVFENQTNLDLYEILSLNKSLKNIPKPITDIVDSFAISQEVYKRYGKV